jgi:hypothetical protein
MREPGIPAILQYRRRVEAIADVDLSPAARLLAVVIAMHANEAGECYPGTSTLARLTRLDPRTIRRIRSSLARIFDYAPGGSRRGEKLLVFRSIDQVTGELFRSIGQG